MNKRFYVLALSLAVLIMLASCAVKDPEQTDNLIEDTSSATEPTEAPEPTKNNGVIIGAPSVSDEESNEYETQPETQPESQPESETEASEPAEDLPTATEGENHDNPESPTEATGVTTSYQEYMNMSADQQEAFISSFESMDAFMVWFNNAKAEYDSTDGAIDVGSGSVDLGDIPGGSG